MHHNLAGLTIGNYQVIKYIGKGQFARVYKALNVNTKVFVAMKVMLKSELHLIPKRMELAKSQIKVLKDCNNPNVIKFYEYFESAQYLFIITQFCNGGDLSNLLLQKRKLPEKQAIAYLKQILNGFKGLRDINAVHRDLKTANILIHNGECKIADLGSTKQLQDGDQTMTQVGTVLSCPPQQLEGKSYGPLADIWALGILFYQMLYGDYPYYAKNQQQLLQIIKKKKIKFDKVKITQQTKDFILKCLTLDPKQRITWQQVYFHPLIGFNVEIKNKQNMQTNTLTSRSTANTNISEKPNSQQCQNITQINAKNINSIQKQQSLINKQQLFAKIEGSYVQKKNDIIFCKKYINPHVQKLYERVKINHSVFLFLAHKKAYKDLNNLCNSMKQRVNLFNFDSIFEEFSTTNRYQDLYDNLKQVQNQTKQLCEFLLKDIKLTTLEIKRQLCWQQSQQKQSSNLQELLKVQLQQYEKLLKKHLNQEHNGKNRQLIIRLIHAISYLKNSETPRPNNIRKSYKNLKSKRSTKQLIKIETFIDIILLYEILKYINYILFILIQVSIKQFYQAVSYF